MDKAAFLTMDVESYFDTTCIQDSGIPVNSKYNCKEEISTFINFLNKHHIKGTFFVNVQFIKETKDYLLQAIKDGHEIALHCLAHHSYKDCSLKSFEKELQESISIIKKELGVTPVGFRFPMFEYKEEFFSVLRKYGFIYDSSVINPNKNLKKIKDTIFIKDDLVEFSPNYMKYYLKNIRISGGGVHRLVYNKHFDRNFNRYLKSHNSFFMYFHPFELSQKELPIPSSGLSKGQIKYLTENRKAFINILENVVAQLEKHGYQFSNMKEYASSIRKDK